MKIKRVLLTLYGRTLKPRMDMRTELQRIHAETGMTRLISLGPEPNLRCSLERLS